MVMSHLSAPLTAPDTLAAMYENNMTQMQTVSPAIVAASVQLIRDHGHRPRFINFLRQICGTRERPMPNNQVRSGVVVLKRWVKWAVGRVICKSRRFPCQSPPP